MWQPPRDIVRFEHDAMHTTFEICVASEEKEYASQAARAAFAEVVRLDGIFNRFDPGSDVAQLNRLKPGEMLPVGIEMIECFEIAREVHDQTGGAFDVTLGNQVACLRDEQPESGQASLREITRSAGMDGVVAGLDGGVPCVGIAPEAPDDARLCLDLGAIAKGYAVDRAAEVLREWSIGTALLGAGGGTALALGPAPEDECWPVGVAGDYGSVAGFDRVWLRDMALSGSGPEAQGEHFVRRTEEVSARLGAWSVCSDAARADAWSTALMVLPGPVDRWTDSVPAAVRGLVVYGTPDAPSVECIGDWGAWIDDSRQTH